MDLQLTNQIAVFVTTKIMLCTFSYGLALPPGFIFIEPSLMLSREIKKHVEKGLVTVLCQSGLYSTITSFYLCLSHFSFYKLHVHTCVVNELFIHKQIEIDLTELQLGQRYQTWYRLQHHEPKQKDKK